VSWFTLSFIILGSVYLLTSVGVSIYRRRHAVPTGELVSAQLTDGEIRGCYQDLDDLMQGLHKHLENFHHLLAGYDPAEAQRWEEEGTVWRGEWKVLGQRCRFHELPATRLRKELEEMSTAHADLGQTHEIYTRALKRFGREQAPRLDQIRKRVHKIGERLAKSSAAPPGENKP
jgi:hypothetical protein